MQRTGTLNVSEQSVRPRYSLGRTAKRRQAMTTSGMPGRNAESFVGDLKIDGPERSGVHRHGV